MEGVEDFDGFESNFLDSMLEVEMTEEEGEVKISQNDDHLHVNERDFPPIPMFDLQSETMTFKTPYGNPPLAVKKASILKSKTPTPSSSYALPSVQSSPMIFIHSDMLKANNVTIQQSIPGNAVPSISGKATPLARPIMPKPARGNELATKLVNKFVLEVFKPDFVKKVYTNKEDLPDVSLIGREEEAFYRFAFQDVSKVQLCRLHCTICDKHIGCFKGVDKKISIHSMLKVLTCKVCSEFYGDGNFPCDDGDHCEIYCRWCGQGGALICCSFCPKVFCKRCIRRNYSQSYVRAVEKSSDWACFVCAQKPLWPHRAVCRALIEYIKNPNIKIPARDTSMCCKPEPQPVNKKTIPEVDRAKVLLGGGQIVQIKPKDNATTSQSSGRTRAPDNVNKAANPSGPMIVKNFSTALRVNSQTKSPVAVINKPMIPIAPKTSTTSSLSKATASKAVSSVPVTRAINIVPAPRTGPVPAPRAGPVPAPRAGPVPSPRANSVPVPRANAVPAPRANAVLAPRANAVLAPRANAVPAPRTMNIRPAPRAANRGPAPRAANRGPAPRVANQGPAPRVISAVNLPRVINTPIYHGQTLITPPRNNMAQKMLPIPQNAETPEPSVMVSVTDSVNVDLNNIPVARIPPSIQGVILRLNFPDNKVQLVRLIRDVDPNDENAPFPIPKFANGDDLDFLEGSLEDTFKLTRMLYERLMKIKEKLDLVTKYNKHGIYKSSVKKLSFIYDRARELMRELDENLLRSYETWEKERDRENDVKIIDLSDDEENSTKKENNSTTSTEKSKTSSHSEDYDVEILKATIEKHIVAQQRILRSSIKREGDGKPFGNHTPEHIDVSAYEAKTKRDTMEKSRKKVKLSDDDEPMEVVERDPLAVSDTELESNSHAKNGLAQ